MDLRVDVGRLADAAEKLLRETIRLRGDVAKLADRLEAFPDEKVRTEPVASQAPRTKWKVVDALNEIEGARKNIIACEHDLSAIRSRMDVIENDVHSREDLKPWIRR